MKAKVLKRFRDKQTGEVLEVDTVYEGERERVKELQRLGYVGENESSVLDGNVESVKQAVEGLDKDSLEKLFEKEMADKNRKGVLEYIEELLSVSSGEGE